MEPRQLHVNFLAIEDPAGRDEGGPGEWDIMRELLDRPPFLLGPAETCPPQQALIRARLRIWSEPASSSADVILTTGGTGLLPRDRMPEATAEVIERSLPGIPDLIRLACLRADPAAALERFEAGVRQRTVIINLPADAELLKRCLPHVVRILPAAVSGLNP